MKPVETLKLQDWMTASATRAVVAALGAAGPQFVRVAFDRGEPYRR